MTVIIGDRDFQYFDDSDASCEIGLQENIVLVLSKHKAMW